MKIRRWLAAWVAVAGLAAPLVRGEDAFTLAVLPDVQQETSGPRFKDRLEWMVQKQKELNIKAMLQVGDLQNWDTPEHEQFKHQSEGLEVLDKAGLPYVMCIGNHDTAAVKVGGSAGPGNVKENLRKTGTYNTFYPASRFKLLKGDFEKGKVDNTWHTFSAGDLEWLVLSLELWPRTEVVAWGKKVVAEHPSHNVIVLTHSFLNGKGEIEKSNGGYGANSPQYVFDELIKPSSNVVMTFSGHVGGHAYRKDARADGGLVYSFLQCYHDNKTNPTRLVEINTKEGTIKSRVYCQSINEDKKDGSTFEVKDVKWVARAKAATRSVPAEAKP